MQLNESLVGLTKRGIRVGIAVAVASICVLSPYSVSHAQDDGTEVKGSLSYKDESGQKTGAEGVLMTATDEAGVEMGSSSSDVDGSWRIPLQPGTYQITLDPSTLPNGVVLKNPDKNPAEVRIVEGNSKSTLFPLILEGAVSTGTATSGGETTPTVSVTVGESGEASSNNIRVIQLIVDGLKFGLIIAMCAIGLSLIYGTTGLTNFAHAEAVTFGAVFGYLLNVTGIFGLRIPLIAAAVIVVIVGGALGGAFNHVVWARMRRRGSSLVAALVVSIGFSILFRYIILYFFGGRAKRFSDFQLQEQWDLGWFRLAPKDLALMIISLLVLIGVASGLQFTRMGKAMRAVSDNRDLAESTGIDVERVISLVWIFGGALAGLGGVLFGVTEAISWEMGFRILLLMFAGVTLGGLGTAYGALFGSIIVGIFIQLSTLVIPADMKNVGALLMLVVILLVRPQGLLGRSERIG